MGGITSLEALNIAIAFVVPGFVFFAVKRQFVIDSNENVSDRLFKYLTVSAVNFAVFSWLINLILYENYSTGTDITLWTIILLLGPAIFGCLFGVSAQKGFGLQVLQKFNLKPIHQVPTAWDWQFGRQDNLWVLVTLKNGVRFAGEYACMSFASSNANERDLYIEKIYDLDDRNQWIERPDAPGVLIVKDEISTIETWKI